MDTMSDALNSWGSVVESERGDPIQEAPKVAEAFTVWEESLELDKINKQNIEARETPLVQLILKKTDIVKTLLGTGVKVTEHEEYNTEGYWLGHRAEYGFNCTLRREYYGGRFDVTIRKQFPTDYRKQEKTREPAVGVLIVLEINDIVYSGNKAIISKFHVAPTGEWALGKFVKKVKEKMEDYKKASDRKTKEMIEKATKQSEREFQRTLLSKAFNIKLSCLDETRTNYGRSYGHGRHKQYETYRDNTVLKFGGTVNNFPFTFFLKDDKIHVHQLYFHCEKDITVEQLEKLINLLNSFEIDKKGKSDDSK